ncbi:MAG: hypothetical protein ACFB0C_01650 [Leptolyngbyaceae cyanobacterium]
MLRLWLLCCGVMFVVSQGYEWASHQAWFGMPHLSLPWLILGGIGLAIASNRTELKSLTSTPPQSPLASAPAATETTVLPTATVPEKAPTQSPQDSKAASISFEINSQRRPQS